MKTERLKKNFVREERTTTVDHNTGEISETTSVKTGLREVEPPFVKLYVKDICNLNGLSQCDSAVLYSIIAFMGYSNVVVLIKPIKERIEEMTGYSESAVKKSIQHLQKAGLLIRRAQSVYLVDPNLFAKGGWQDIKKLRLVVTYDNKGRKTINSNAVKQLELDI